MMKRKLEPIKLHKYVGESSSSVYERAWEHVNRKDKLHTDSHMHKHILDKHRDCKLNEVEFGIRVLRFMRTSFERQIMESVLIQHESKGHHIMIPKSEYNRCSLPRLTAKMGEREITRFKKELEEEKRKEEALENEIKMMRKERNKERIGEHTKREQPSEKRRKLEESRWVSVRQKETAPPTKRSHEIEVEEKKWEEKSGKNKRERYNIKKYLVTKKLQR